MERFNFGDHHSSASFHPKLEWVHNAKKAVVKISIMKQVDENRYEDAVQGSGVFITENGHILTVANLVPNDFGTQQAYKFLIVLDGKIIGYASQMKIWKSENLAMLKLDNYKSNYVSIGDCVKMPEDASLYVVGYPGSLPNTVITTGCLSSRLHQMLSGQTATNTHRTDAPTNPSTPGYSVFYEDKLVGLMTGGVPLQILQYKLTKSENEVAYYIHSFQQGVTLFMPLSPAQDYIDKLVNDLGGI